MSEQNSGFFSEEAQNSQQAFDLVARLLRVAEPGAVYGPITTVGDRSVILASELTISLGVGYGGGRSLKPASAETAGAVSAPAVGDMDSAPDAVIEHGIGGGGGGFAAGRPVAAVIIEPGGVRVEPVVDVTKLGLAFITTLLAMLLAWSRARQALSTTNQ